MRGNKERSWKRKWQPTPVLLPGKSHGWRSLVGAVHGVVESDTTKQLHFHFSLSSIGEGNGNPLQCSCLENPRNREPGKLPSMGSHRVRHYCSDLAAAKRGVERKGKTDSIEVWSMGTKSNLDQISIKIRILYFILK